MSNNAEANNDDRDINTLKSTINSLIQENKKLLGSSEQLKIEDSKLRDFIHISALELETQREMMLDRLNNFLQMIMNLSPPVF